MYSVNQYHQMNNTMPAHQHVNHTFDNLIVSEHMPLIGQLSKVDYIFTYGLYSLRYQHRVTLTSL